MVTELGTKVSGNETIVVEGVTLSKETKKEYYEDDTTLVIPEKYRQMSLEELEYKKFIFEEAYELLKLLGMPFQR